MMKCAVLMPVAFLVSLLAEALASEHVYLVKLQGQAVLEFDGDRESEGTRPKGGQKLQVHEGKVQRYVLRLRAVQERVAAEVGATLLYSYSLTVNGFAARMTAAQAELLRQRPEVMLVTREAMLHPLTDSTPRFLGVSERGGAWMRGYTGDGVVVGVVDSGIMPEHPSFSDEPTAKGGAWDEREEEYAPLPPGRFEEAACVFGNTGYNSDDAPFECNKKIVKANYFVDGFLSEVGDLSPHEFLSARDSNSHGSHVASTAAGNYGVRAAVPQEGSGEEVLLAPDRVSGVAPRARLAVYKVCWEGPNVTLFGPCAEADIVAGVEEAVADGVDVINFSIGCGPRSCPPQDFLNVGGAAFLSAVQGNVWVTAAAGNGGAPGTLNLPASAPWVTAVGAVQDEQVYMSAVTVSEPAGLLGAEGTPSIEGRHEVSLGLTGPIEGLIVPTVPAEACDGLTEESRAQVRGNIALVARGACTFTKKFVNAAAAGARAIIVYTHEGTELFPMGRGNVSIPGVMVGHKAGRAMAEAHATHGRVVGRVSGEKVIGTVDRIAEFSSRGPNPGDSDILKPDVVAPGVEILAAGTSQPHPNAIGGLFRFHQGTSMASPHVAGMLALLRQAHPEWTAAMARSALMTTARNEGLRQTSGDGAATPFEVGAGAVVNSASSADDMFRPGLVFNIEYEEYIAFTCSTVNPAVDKARCRDLVQGRGLSPEGKDLNLPSISLSRLRRDARQTVHRRVTGVAGASGVYEAVVEAPPGIQVRVTPAVLRVAEGETASFAVTFAAETEAEDGWVFGSLTWGAQGPAGTCSLRQQRVRIPVALRVVAPDTQAPSTPAPSTPAPATDAPVATPCPPTHPYAACDRCWVDKRQAESGGCLC